MEGTDDQPDQCHVPGGILPGKSDRGCQITALVHCVAVSFHYISGTITTAAQQDDCIPTTPDHCCTASELDPEPCGLTSIWPFWWSNSSTRDFTSTSVLPTRYSLGMHSLNGAPFFQSPSHPLTEQVDHSPSGPPDHSHTKRTHVCSPEIEVRVESSSAWGNQNTGVSFLRLDLGLALNKKGKNMSVLLVSLVPLWVW